MNLQNQKATKMICDFEMIIYNANIPIKFPCHFFIELKSQKGRVLVTGQKVNAANKANIQWNQVLKFKYELDWEKIQKKFIKKEISLVVNLVSKSRPDQVKQVGRIKINLSQINNCSQQQKHLILTQKLTYCSLNADITFQVKAVSKVQKDINVEQSQKSFSKQTNQNFSRQQKQIQKKRTQQNRQQEDQIELESAHSIISSKSIKQIISRFYQKDETQQKQQNKQNASFQRTNQKIQQISQQNLHHYEHRTQSTSEQNQKQQKPHQYYNDLIQTLQCTIYNLQQQIESCHQVIKINENLKDDLIKMQEIMKEKENQLFDINQIVEELKKEIEFLRKVQECKENERIKQNQEQQNKLLEFKKIIEQLETEKSDYAQKNLMFEVETFNLEQKIQNLQKQLEQAKQIRQNQSSSIRQIQIDDLVLQKQVKIQQYECKIQFLSRQKRDLQEQIEHIYEIKQEQVSQLQSALQNQSLNLKVLAESLIQKENRLYEKDNQINRLNAKLEELNGKIVELKTQLVQNQNLKQINLQFRQKVQMLINKQYQVQEAARMLQEENKKINQIFEQKLIIDQQVHLLKQKMHQQVEEIVFLKEQITKSQRLKKQSEKKCQNIVNQLNQSINRLIREKDEQIVKYQQKIQMLQKRIKEKQQEIAKRILEESGVKAYSNILQNFQNHQQNLLNQTSNPQPTASEISILSYQNESLFKQNQNLKTQINFLNLQLQNISKDFNSLNLTLLQRQDQILVLKKQIQSLGKQILMTRQKQSQINDMQRYYIVQMQNLQGHIQFLNSKIQQQKSIVIQPKQPLQALSVQNNILQDVRNFRDFIIVNLKQMNGNVKEVNFDQLCRLFNQVEIKIKQILNLPLIF